MRNEGDYKKKVGPKERGRSGGTGRAQVDGRWFAGCNPSFCRVTHTVTPVGTAALFARYGFMIMIRFNPRPEEVNATLMYNQDVKVQAAS
jgi:hypothetical protein